MNNKIGVCLWFENQAEEAANFYTSVFRNSVIQNINFYGKEGFEFHRQKEGSVMTVSFLLNGLLLTALNAGPLFKFNEAVSLVVYCDNQEEIDYYWDKLTDGGEESQCGWLKDKYGVSWQIVPALLPELLGDPEKAGRVTKAFMQMKKFDLEKLLNA